MIGKISGPASTPFTTNETDRLEKKGVKASGSERKERERADTFTLTEPNPEVPTYAPLSTERRIENKFLFLRELVSKVFHDQGLSTLIDVGNGKTADITEMNPGEAKKLVADDGYWGVEQTSERIFAFAVSLSGGDPGMLEQIKEGVLKGFEMAKKSFGMHLPEISEKTIEATMAKLNSWAQEQETPEKA